MPLHCLISAYQLHVLAGRLSPEATYPTAEAVRKTKEFVLTCGDAFSPDYVQKASIAITSMCKWVLALVNRGGGVPMPAQVASVPASVAPAAPATAEAERSSRTGSSAAAAAAAVGEGMEDLIGTTLQRMADQLDVLTV